MSTTEEKLTGQQADNTQTGDAVDEVLDPSVNKVASTDDLGRNYHLFVAGTDEGDQKLKPRSQTTARELLREVGSVLRMSEADAANLGELPTTPKKIRR